VSVSVVSDGGCSGLQVTTESTGETVSLSPTAGEPCRFEGVISVSGQHEVRVFRDGEVVAQVTREVPEGAEAKCLRGPSTGFALELTVGGGAGQADQGGGGSGGLGGGGAGAGGGDPVPSGGYVDAGPWHGYAWVELEFPSQGSTVTPSDYGTHTFGAPLCAEGTVAASATSTAYALVAFFLNEPAAGGAESAWYAAGSGIAWALSNPGGSALQLEVGVRATGSRWCAPITGATGTTPWAQFTSDCQGGTLPAFDGASGLTYAGLRVMGQPDTATPFSFCLNDLAPAP